MARYLGARYLGLSLGDLREALERLEEDSPLFWQELEAIKDQIAQLENAAGCGYLPTSVTPEYMLVQTDGICYRLPWDRFQYLTQREVVSPPVCGSEYQLYAGEFAVVAGELCVLAGAPTPEPVVCDYPNQLYAGDLAVLAGEQCVLAGSAPIYVLAGDLQVMAGDLQVIAGYTE